MNLFEPDPTLTFPTKRAAVELEEDPTAWPRQVLTELYRALPEITDYIPEVSFLKVDEEQGYGLGVVVVSSSTNSALSQQGSGGASGRKALIPVIVKNHSLLPLDMLLSGKGRFVPLTVDRLREALFRPENFDLLSDEMNDASLWNMFHPPGRGDSSFGSGVSQGLGGTSGAVSVITGPGMKLSSDYALLSALAGTYLEPDITDFAARIETTPGLMKAASQNPSFLHALRLLAESPCITKTAVDERVDALDSLYPAQVVQLSYSEVTDRYGVKTANRDAGAFKTLWLERGAFLKFAGDELTKRVDTEGTLTISEKDPGITVIEGPNGAGLKVCEQSGYYTVYNTRGKTLTGWVIPGLLDGTGKRLPISLFTDGKVHATQDQIAVAPLGYSERVDLPFDAPKGMGCFWYRVENYGDSLRATVPVDVKGAHHSEDGSTVYECSDFTGQTLKITLAPGAKGAVALPGNELVIPHSAGFAALGPAVALVSTGEIQLRPGDGVLGKCASDPLAQRIQVTSYGDELYGLRFTGVPKLASLYAAQDTLGQADAAFALCLAGHGAQDAFNALTQADARSHAWVGARDLGDSAAFDMKTASAKVTEIHALRHDLVKEAASLPDVMTVDSVLSLGFINTENVQTFLTRIPYLEKALSMVCEFTLASRLGLTEIPESASARCMKALDATLQGLKALALREISDVA